jgi:hypothetical protein
MPSEDRIVDNRRPRGARQIANSRNRNLALAVKHKMAVICQDRSPDAASGAQAIRKIGLEFRQFYWYRSFLSYLAKHFPAVLQEATGLAVLVGSSLGTAVSICRQRSLNPIAVNSKVVRLAGYLNSVASTG